MTLRERLADGWSLDRSTDTPVHAQIHERLAALIRADVLSSGERVPSERTLADWLGVSRITARTALAGLADDGLVVRSTGRSGTSVARPRVSHDLGRFRGLSESVAGQGLAVWTRLLSLGTEPASALAVEQMGLEPDERVHRVRRLRFIAGRPATVEDSVFPERLFPDLLEHDLRGSIYVLLAAHYQLAPVRSLERLAAVAATTEQADLLGVATGAPLLRLDRVGRAADGRPVELSADLYRTDQVEFVVHGIADGSP